MSKNSDKKCKKQDKKKGKICLQMEDKDNCAQWAKAMQTKCKVNSGCKIDLKTNRGECDGYLKVMLHSFTKEDAKVPEGITH